MNIVSLNEHMALNLNELYVPQIDIFLLMEIISLNEYVFLERGYISLNELISSLKRI